MIALMFFAVAQAPAIIPTIEPEIVVIARRLKDWRGRASATERGIQCRTTKSTGDKNIDQIACDSLRYCMSQLTPDAVAANDKKLLASERNARLVKLNVRLAACGEEQQRLRIAHFVERRAAARIQNVTD